MTSHGEQVVTDANPMRKLSKDYHGFPHDTVTARAISRLSQGVARMTANDPTELDPNSLEVLFSNAIFLGQIAQWIHTFIAINSIWWPEFTKWWSTQRYIINFWVIYSAVRVRHKLVICRSSLAQVRFPLPLLNTGSKRSFNYVLGSSPPLNMRSVPNGPITSRRQSYLTRFQPIICDDTISSDSSMLSITPPRSEPTASSSPEVSSSMDESHSYCFHSTTRHKRWRRRRKDWHHRKRNSHSTGVNDCRWNDWRNPTPLLEERNAHRASRRVDILEDDDSSEEGPLKKARVTEKVFENSQLDRCQCNHRQNRPRRTASLSPKRSHQYFSKQHDGNIMITADSRIHRKPTKFRKSLLATRSPFSRNFSMHFER